MDWLCDWEPVAELDRDFDLECDDDRVSECDFDLDFDVERDSD